MKTNYLEVEQIQRDQDLPLSITDNIDLRDADFFIKYR